MKKILPIFISLLAVSTLTGCNMSFNPEHTPSQPDDTENKPNDETVYTITLDKDNQLDAGDITKNNIHFHFDENSVNEHPSNLFIEIGPHGSLYLENYVPGLTEVHTKAIVTTEYIGEYFLASSSTPNSVEHFVMYTSTTCSISLSPDMPYFSIHNRAGVPLYLESIQISGQKVTEDQEPLKNKIKVQDQTVRYDPDATIDPYLSYPIKEEDIPNNRIVRKISGDQVFKNPGKYTYGYEVYKKNEDGSIGKMMYSSVAELAIENSIQAGQYLAIFHLPDGNTSIINVPNHQKVDISSDSRLLTINWNSPVNDFDTPFYGDRHYYPVFSVVGLPVNKDGDGCYPVNTTYNMLEKTFEMPDPQMMDGYKFGGWYMDYELTIPYDPDAAYTGDITLYAKCVETDQDFRKVYYHDYDGKFLNKVDLLYVNDSLALPKFKDIGTTLNERDLMYEVRVGTNRIGMLMPENDYSETGHYNGDRLTYDMIKTYTGDIHLYVSKFEFYYNGPGQFTQIFEDSEQNTVISGYRMSETYQDGDLVLPGRYVQINKSTWAYDFNLYNDPQRGDEFLVTDEVHGYLADQGSFNSITTYGYGNKYSINSKPLKGIVRHEGVIKVGRRAFFNRYGLEGTYFPRNAREFDVESYANTTFNEVLMLPKNLQKIGQRAFMGSKNIKYVALPKSLKSVGKDAFSMGTYDESTSSFKDIHERINTKDLITFYYEGSEVEFNRLDENTRQEIENNALKIVYNYNYHPRYGK